MSGQGSTSSSWKLWAVIGGLVLPVCFCALCALCGLGATLLGALGVAGLIAGEIGPAQEAAAQFLSALRDEQWEAAYALCAPSFQRQLGGSEELARRHGGDRRPVQWSFSRRSVEVKNGVRGATLEGTLTTAGGERFSFSMELRTRAVGSGEVWEVSAFRTD
ncbi:hypothetical protein [Thermoflexus hugenholtzii]